MSITRQSFDKSLEGLQQEILRMGSLVEQSIFNAVDSLKQKDVSIAQKVIDSDELINQMELEIEDHCIKLIATQQPMAKDLRRIGAGFKIITDLERMGDHAVDIAKITLRLDGQPLIKPLIDIPRMAELSREMVSDSLDSYVKSDMNLAKSLKAKDDEIDHLYASLFDELFEFMARDPATIQQATYLLFIGRYIERIGDHATNIGERVIYLVTGERKTLND